MEDTKPFDIGSVTVGMCVGNTEAISIQRQYTQRYHALLRELAEGTRASPVSSIRSGLSLMVSIQTQAIAFEWKPGFILLQCAITPC